MWIHYCSKSFSYYTLYYFIIFFYIFSEERKWRKWADDVFVHTLSPNVYRTLDESYKTFNWFSEVSESMANIHNPFLFQDLK